MREVQSLPGLLCHGTSTSFFIQILFWFLVIHFIRGSTGSCHLRLSSRFTRRRIRLAVKETSQSRILEVDSALATVRSLIIVAVQILYTAPRSPPPFIVVGFVPGHPSPPPSHCSTLPFGTPHSDSGTGWRYRMVGMEVFINGWDMVNEFGGFIIISTFIPSISPYSGRLH